MTDMNDFHAKVYFEAGAYWAEVEELPGCFASGVTETELHEALVEAIRMCADGDEPLCDLRLAGLTLVAG